MTTVMIRLVLTLTSPNGMPIRIDKQIPIKLGVHVDGRPIARYFLDRGTLDVGELEFDLVLPPNASFEFPSQKLTGGIAYVGVDGRSRIYEIDAQPQPMTQAYSQLVLLGAEYKLEN